MNKLTVLIVLSLVAFVTSYHYDFTIGLSDQQFFPVTGLASLYVKSSRNPSSTNVIRWKSNLVPNTNQTSSKNIVPYTIEELTNFMFKWKSIEDPHSTQSIKLKDFYLVPAYLNDPIKIAKKTIRICPSTPHEEVDAGRIVELTAYSCFQ